MKSVLFTMKRVEIKRETNSRGPLHTQERNFKKEKELLSKCTVTEDGFIVYPGDAPLNQRIGSPVTQLIEWYLYKNSNEKPIDSDLFKAFVDEQIK